jgi:hypothetical protein
VDSPLLLIDADGMHRGEVDHKTPVADPAAAHVMAATSYGENKVVFAGEVYPRDDIRDARAPRNHCRPLVYQAVPDPPRLLITPVIFANESAAKPLRERLQRLRTQLGEFATDGSEGCHAQLPDLTVPTRALDVAVRKGQNTQNRDKFTTHSARWGDAESSRTHLR